ncbi:hypothetical protein TPA0907_55810 [Micromonospora humidisoli]|uniref:hypothetical protein n=1 Tax=Micromonospora sp. AKA109 TaxID=2733865 RepID=UPI0022CCDA39|nr:hypothetical protein [Micromonospora sp. AKA109]GHJ11214.1 hypothetical protein TPA0907_55810 [Micromonospora sp. AKA109]
MIREHVAAVLPLLQAAPGNTPLVVLDGAVPSGQMPPYTLVYFADNDPEDRSLEDEQSRYVLWIYCHNVGGNADAARKVATRARAALLGVVPTVPGRSCWPIRREDGDPPERDESTGTLVMDQVDVYRLESVPAA